MDVAINYSIDEIAEITGGKIIQHIPQEKITHLLLDSRKLVFPGTTIFFALGNKGTRFIRGLYEREVKCFLIDDKNFNISSYPQATFIVVENVLEALHLLAAHHRSKFTLHVIGITGSNGKTIVKEWLYQLLEKDFTIARSPKSYNSQIGVPLSVLQINHHHTLAIFEAGISQPDEMEELEKIIHPSLGVFTNIGDAHSEGFENKAQKIKEKLKLFQHASSLIVCTDDNDLNKEINVFKTDTPPNKFIYMEYKGGCISPNYFYRKERSFINYNSKTFQC